MVPYSQGISESLKNICQRYGIQVHFKGGATIKNLLVSPNDKDSITKKSSVIYWFKCDKIDCEEEYIGESSKTFGERYSKHLKAPSPIYEHQNNTGHTTVYVWQCYMCRDLKGCLGVRCHVCRCVGALQYTMLIFGFPFFGC